MSHFLSLARVQLIFNMEVVYMCYRDLLLKNEFVGVFSSKLMTSPALIVIQTVNGHVAVENFLGNRGFDLIISEIQQNLSGVQPCLDYLV